MSLTTRVNNRDRPVGSIAIVVVQETAEKFSEGKEEAAWYLINRTYMDDGTEEPMIRRQL